MLTRAGTHSAVTMHSAMMHSAMSSVRVNQNVKSQSKVVFQVPKVRPLHPLFTNTCLIYLVTPGRPPATTPLHPGRGSASPTKFSNKRGPKGKAKNSLLPPAPPSDDKMPAKKSPKKTANPVYLRSSPDEKVRQPFLCARCFFTIINFFAVVSRHPENLRPSVETSKKKKRTSFRYVIVISQFLSTF